MMTMTAWLTNREKLMEELAGLSNEALYLAFADNRLTRAIVNKNHSIPCLCS